MEEKDITEQTTEEDNSPDALVTIAQNKQNDVLAKLIREDDLEKTKDLTHLFNIYQTKRNALRINTLNDVQDALVNQMLERLSKYPDNFANKDIADWMKTIQMVIDNNNERVEHLDDIPTIRYQQNNQVNVNIVDGLSRESREKITNVLEALMKDAANVDENMVLSDENITETTENEDKME